MKRRSPLPPLLAALVQDAAAGAFAGLLLTGLLLASNAFDLLRLMETADAPVVAPVILAAANAMTCAVGAIGTGLFLRGR